MSDRVTLATAQNRLAILWLTATGAIFVLLLAQTVAGKYGGQAERAWAWFVPALVPTLSLILSSLAYAATKRTGRNTVEKRAYRISFLLSAFYLLVALSTLLLQPFSDLSPLEFLSMSHLWLGALQGLVGVALGAFFTSKM
jgi:hypothetical protein